MSLFSWSGPVLLVLQIVHNAYMNRKLRREEKEFDVVIAFAVSCILIIAHLLYVDLVILDRGFDAMMKAVDCEKSECDTVAKFEANQEWSSFEKSFWGGPFSVFKATIN